MTDMNEKLVLDYKKIKAIAGIFDEYRDDVLIPIIDAVALYAYHAGVSKETLESATAQGMLACGMKDMDSPGASGDAKFSPLFDLMLNQLSYGR